MGIDDSYRVMLNKLAEVRTTAEADFVSLRHELQPALLAQAAERKSLAEMFARYDLSSADESRRLMLETVSKLETESRHANALTAAALEAHWRDRVALSVGSLQSAWEEAFKGSRVLENDLAKNAAMALYASHPEELLSSVLQTAARWELEVANSHGLLAGLTSTWDARWRESFRRLEGVENLAVTVPRLAAENWPAELVSNRISLIEHSFGNVSALQSLEGSVVAAGEAWTSTEPLTAAGQFVFENVDFLRRMPPALRFDRQTKKAEAEAGRGHRSEEVGAKLESLLGAVDGRLLDLRRQSWQKLSGGVAGARLAMLGLRELFGDLLRLLAPDQEIIHNAVWQGRSSDLPPNPTRSERIVFLMGPDAPQLKAILQFDASVESSHKFAHTFADDPEMVRVHMAQLESWIYLLLLYSRKGN